MDDKIISYLDSVLVRWNRMSLEGLQKSDAITLATAQSFANKINYFAIVPTTLPIPDAAVRAHMAKNLSVLRSSCRTISVVVEGQGLKQAALRSIAASFLLLGDRNMHVFGSLEAAVNSLKLPNAEALIEVARREAMIV